MDIATRLQSRTRGQNWTDREKDAGSKQSQSEDVHARRKSFRPGMNNDDASQFRKPSLPASATRTIAHQRTPSGSSTQAGSAATHRRRTSAVMRDTRVPSGPRDYPGSPGKRNVSGPISQTRLQAPQNRAGTKQPPSSLYTAITPELPFSHDHTFAYSPQEELTRGYFSNPVDDFSEPTTPASHRDRNNSASMEFLPSVNFDEFQSSLSTLDPNPAFDVNLYHGLQTQPTRALRSDTSQSSKDRNRSTSLGRKLSLSRGNSFRDRSATLTLKLPAEPKSVSATTAAVSAPGPIARATAAFRARRQSTVTPAHDVQKTKKESRQARTTGGPPPALHMHSASTGGVPPATAAATISMLGDQASVNAMKSRRITMSNFGPEEAVLRSSGDSGPTGKSRSKTLMPSHLDPDPNTPTTKINGRGGSHTHTPSSSGGNNRRQSIASGRLSGLGARTISPTDTRRQKRLSMAPPQPSMPVNPYRGASSHGEEMPMYQHLQKHNKFAELPRLTSPSTTTIPSRDTSSSLASDSARFSPAEAGASMNKFGFPHPGPPTSGQGTLSAKSSYASLHTIGSATNSNTQSRVPVPRSRTAASTTTAGSSGDDSRASTEVIPPVPAIPKAYDSPKEAEALPFGQLGPIATNRKSSVPYLPPHFGQSNDPAFQDIARSSHESDRLRTVNKRKSMAASYDSSTTSRPVPTSYVSTGPLETSASFAGFPHAGDETGRQNGNLQPLRLPPLNLVPITLSGKPLRNEKHENGPRPSNELDDRSRGHVANGTRTPEWPRHGHKTPSTPMTASKATFLHRAAENNGNQGKIMRSSTSHFGLRGATAHENGALRTGWLDDSGDEVLNQGNLSTAPSRQNFSRATAASRNAITPFASGSLPKGSGEFARFQSRPSADFTDDLFLPHSLGQSQNSSQARQKPKTSRPRVGSVGETNTSLRVAPDAERLLIDPSTGDQETPTGKKENGGLRRKLSLGWRRSGSKAANHAENQKGGDVETPKPAKDGTHTTSKLPPKLPSSMAFNGDGSLGLPLSARPSLDESETGSLSDRLRKRTLVGGRQVSHGSGENDNLASSDASEAATSKTRSLHSERPQPVTNNRASSWGTFNRTSLLAKPQVTQPKATRHAYTASTINVLIKDDDDLAADEEMRRLTQKKKDVDNVAVMTEELLRRASPRTAMSIDEVLHDRHATLNIFERGEVIEYENEGIFFTGTKHAKKIVGSLHPSSQPTELKGSDKANKSSNYGYDDERGDYNIVFGDHLAYRYEVCDVLGKGSFGQVVRCIDHKEGGVVAVKIIRNKKRFHQQALVEVGILGKLREWDPDGAHATLSITGSFYFRSHLCIVTPCLSINLYELIRAHNFSGFSLPLIRRFARQLLACLVLLQDKRVIHCDLKPENILLCSARAADVRVIDFGSSCREEEKVYTYIQSRFYRSPEVILGSSYGLGIDMWSFGCILAELWTGYPIFPGENEQEQLACIMEIFGPPDRHLVERCTRKKLFFDSVGKPRVTVSSKGRRRRPSSKTLQQALKTEDEHFIDFITKCLRWDPERRLKPTDACRHAFVTNQPLHYRPSSPDEGRRAARVRSTAAVPTVTTAPSPVKRIHPQQASISSTQPIAAVPSTYKTATGTRQLLSKPQTALRAPTMPATNGLQSSPVKSTANRRQSNIASAGSAAALKRQSNAPAASSNFGLPASKTSTGIGNLAEKAARESMAATATTAAGTATSSSGGRWRM